MPSLVLLCPHCGTQQVGFRMVNQVERKGPPNTPAGTLFTTLNICTICEGAVVAEFTRVTGADRASPMECPSDPVMSGWHIRKTYPESAPARIPEHATEQLKRYFAQAVNASKRGDWDASGAMSRKVIDVSTQQLLGQESKKYNSIKARIDALAANGKITTDLQQWAHEIRLGGNDAAHDEDPYTEAEAHELLDFTELYLTYVYTLPGRLNERRTRAAAEKAGGANP